MGEQSEVEKYYTVRELEERLSVSRSTLDRLAKSGKLEKVKFGNKTLFTGRSVNACLSMANYFERSQTGRA